MAVDSSSCDLLLAIARTPGAFPAEQLALLASRVRDWEALLRLAQEHRVLPMLYMRLSTAFASVPPDALASIRAQYNRNVLHSLANAAELIELLRDFDQKGIPAMPFKGVVLAASVYGDLTARSAGDLDLLIRFEDLEMATGIFLARGYELTTALDHDGMPAIPEDEYHFERRQDGMICEVRWGLTPQRLRRPIKMDFVWHRRQTATLAGATVADMDAESLLIILCMHGSKHAWERLIWICDVAQVLAKYPDLAWDSVEAKAKRLGLMRSLKLGVLLAHRFSGVAVPPVILQRFESDDTIFKLVQHIQKTLFEAPGSTPSGRMPYNVRLLGFRDRLRLVLSPAFLCPKDPDRATLRLPRALHWLYYLIRPFRLLLDKSQRR
jgi:Uncharacterised nucleotidyltransferase